MDVVDDGDWLQLSSGRNLQLKAKSSMQWVAHNPLHYCFSDTHGSMQWVAHNPLQLFR